MTDKGYYCVYLPGVGYYASHKPRYSYCRFVCAARNAKHYKTYSAARRRAQLISPRAVVEEYEWR